MQLQCGINWTCQLDEAERCEHFAPEWLHALAPAAPELAVPEFLPERLATVQVAEVAGWLYEYQYNDDAPVDLMRKKPDSQLYADVLTRARSIESLDGDDLRSLRYMVPGAVHGTRPCCGQGSDGVGGTAAALQWSSRSLGRRRHMLGTCCKLMLLLVCCAFAGPAATAPKLDEAATSSADSQDPSAAELSGIRDRLQQAAAGSWTLKYVCAQAGKTGCPFALECEHISGSDSVWVWQTEAHRFHDPDSATDHAKLGMHPTKRQMATALLRCGVKPLQVCNELNALDTSTSLAQASNARHSIILPQVYALQKQVRRQAGYGLTSDAKAVAAQMEEYDKLGCVAYWQPYRERGDHGPEQPLVIILQSPFQKRMLNEFGRRLVFLDATGGTNKYGYMTYALVVSWRCCACCGQAAGHAPAGLLCME